MTYVPPDPPVTPHLMVQDGHRALAWYLEAFAGTENNRFDMDDGRLGHAMLTLENGAAIYLADEFPEAVDHTGTLAPPSLGGASVTLSLAVEDVDRWLGRAEAAGGTVIRAAADEFWGRHAKLRDPFGHVWSFTGPKAGA
ncbi:MAG: VOC family protein [Alphaproteobacteria bacterium]|nr:VOC family protein [Alphaproteobacteria bacterium]MBU1524803.1 VOC family protein [Alphaproteobacteria bacterium]MBU2116765.1 VOC family protein [Alphaproteobacteria bacterium]MBU2351075.1 VOC family protein [Alphaproteobacteria bacterium]MBU2382029.1 VOC family protein [Alphaproteobacteria bacterium]